MKKIILSTLALCAFGAAHAQEGIQWGAKAGLNMSNISGMKSMEGGDAKGKTGFYVGALASKNFGDKFGVQVEALYSMEGADKAKLDYLRVPIMAKYAVIKNLDVMLGPELGFKIGDEESTKETKSFDYGVAVGAAYKFTDNIFVDVRYNMGLADIKNTSYGDKLTNTNFQIGVGYKF